MFKNGLKKVTYLFRPVEPFSLKSMGMEGSRTAVSKWDCEQSFNLFIPLSGDRQTVHQLVSTFTEDIAKEKEILIV